MIKMLDFYLQYQKEVEMRQRNVLWRVKFDLAYFWQLTFVTYENIYKEIFVNLIYNKLYKSNLTLGEKPEIIGGKSLCFV